MAHVWHLAKRFLGSLSPFGPSSADVSWVEQRLLPGEAALWRTMSGPDRRHSVAVGRRVDDAIAGASRPVLAAAMLHDVGKVVSALGTYRRVFATVAIKVMGRSRAMAWAHAEGFPQRIGLYADHPAIGAQLLEGAGSEPLTVAWAREHHLPEQRWTVPLPVAKALKAADDD